MKIKQIKMDALEAGLNWIAHSFKAVDLFTIEGDRYADRKAGKPLKWGVNWGACGTQSVEDTIKFADTLKHAAEICKVVNALQLESSTISDEIKYSEEQYEAECKTAATLLELGDVDFLKVWLDKEVGLK